MDVIRLFEETFLKDLHPTQYPKDQRGRTQWKDKFVGVEKKLNNWDI